ncbi:methyl-accepting chemotaxis protein [Oceanobacillus chungangensis]|uniref:Methyl-accepting chemotaxis protein n=1 Tax=Oceanobacillus chungangensis TaxID=1229152 RepID=A0A3D8Q1A5_9BACI|nr:methyl-accepting chemotaxis protein [Oceanobacillus chungangensis]RDW21189.1 methyl-accepting chemotaxis protein [Oceanobacillus chungangensis]
MKKKQKNRKIKRFTWKDIKIGQKYLIAFFTTVGLIIIASFIVFLQLNKTEDNIKAIEKQNVWVNDMTHLSSLIQLQDFQIAEYLLTQDAQYIDTYNEYTEEVNTIMADMTPKLTTKKQKEAFNTIQDNINGIKDTFLNKMVPSVEDDLVVYATSLRSYSSNYRNEILEQVEHLTNDVKKDQEELVKTSTNNINSSILILFIAIFTVVVIGTILMLFVSRNIAVGLSNLVKLTKEVADGNLQVDSIDYNGKDEIGQLAATINQMKDSLKHILSNIAKAANSVSTRSEDLTQSAKEVKEGNIQIARTMEELSTGAETQANGASDLAENMSEFVQRVIQSEKSGQEIAASSNDILSLTNNGTTLMNKSVSQMKQIDTIVSAAVEKVKNLDKQSAEISKLVIVIRDIADQTNLLSLNAAIEAARAGEHGKGFAVVADEVRKLADQVSSSVEGIKTIVTAIQTESIQVVETLSTGYHEVQEGTTQIEATGKSFASINAAVSDMAIKIDAISNNLNEITIRSSDMNNVIEDIASVSEESAAGVEQVAASTQQSASSMEEVSHNADELADLAEQMNYEINLFRL